jgi:hypothetical protein
LQILVFFRNVLVEYFATEEIEEEALAEVVHTFFNLDAHLYTVAMQSPGSAASALGVLRETTYLKVLYDHLIAGRLSSSQEINGQENNLNQVFTPVSLTTHLMCSRFSFLGSWWTYSATSRSESSGSCHGGWRSKRATA